MAATNFSQSGAELRIQDRGVHEISAMLENSPPASTEDWDRSHGFPWRLKSRKKKNVTNEFDTYNALWS